MLFKLFCYKFQLLLDFKLVKYSKIWSISTILKYDLTKLLKNSFKSSDKSFFTRLQKLQPHLIEEDEDKKNEIN